MAKKRDLAQGLIEGFRELKTGSDKEIIVAVPTGVRWYASKLTAQSKPAERLKISLRALQ